MGVVGVECDDDIVVVRAFNCYEIKEYFKGNMVCPVLEEQSPFKAMFSAKDLTPPFGEKLLYLTHSSHQ